MIFNDRYFDREIAQLIREVTELKCTVELLKAGQIVVAEAVDKAGKRLYPADITAAVAISQILKHLGLSLQQVIPDAPKTTYKLVTKNDSKE